MEEQGDAGEPAAGRIPRVRPVQGRAQTLCVLLGMVAGVLLWVDLAWGADAKLIRLGAAVFAFGVGGGTALAAAAGVHWARWHRESCRLADREGSSAPGYGTTFRRWSRHHTWPVLTSLAIVTSFLCVAGVTLVAEMVRTGLPGELGWRATESGLVALFPQRAQHDARAGVVIRPDAEALARLTSDAGAEVTIESRPGHAEVRLESTGGTLWIRIPPDSPPELVAHDAKGNEVWRLDGSGARATAAPAAAEGGK